MNKKGSLKRERFAVGYNKYKIFWIFMMGGIMGCILETIWCYFAFGEISSRTSNLFLPFSSVWGLGCALFTVFLHSTKEMKTFNIFIKGYVLGGIFEFICGYFCQVLLGVTFWDYSGLPFTLGHYVNLIFCLFWGVVAIVWAKWIYPFLSKLIERAPRKAGIMVTKVAVCFMVVTAAISGVALLRMSERQLNVPAKNVVEMRLDKYFPDHVMKKYFPKMKYISEPYLKGDVMKSDT